MRLRFFIYFFSLTLLAVGCHPAQNRQPEEVPQNPYQFQAGEASTVLTKAEEEMVGGINGFGYNVAKCLAPTLTEGSTVFSPLSAAILLGMREEGAVGETAEEISQVLGFGSQGREQINQFCRNMMVIADHSEDATVSLANAIMLNKGYALKDSYQKATKEYYDAESVTLDFALGSSLDFINKWASDKTNGLIPKLLDELTPNAVAYLMNALYFKAAWQEPFATTKNGVNFTKEDGNTSKVEMMSLTEFFTYAESDDVQKLSLPYQGGAYRMDVVLPREGKTVSEVIGLLGSDAWKELNQSAIKTKVAVSLPSFTTAAHIDLLPVLTSLGVKKAFAGGDYSGISSSDDLSFDMIFQKAKIMVDKKGTEAAAVTVVGTEGAAMPGEELDPVLFRADKPFLYLITEKTTGAVLFIGAYMGD